MCSTKNSYIIFFYSFTPPTAPPASLASLQTSAFFSSTAAGQECHTEQIGEPWTSASHVTCAVECIVHHPDTCQSIVYNAHTKACTPGAVAFRPLQFITTSIPSTSSTDTIYFAKQPVPPCDTSTGRFHLYETCGLSLCLHVSSSQAYYSEAKRKCERMGSSLIMTNTMARLSMFWYITRDLAKLYIWVGLDDIDQEGKFVWANGEPLSGHQNGYIWLSGQPNDYEPGQDCVQLQHTDVNIRKGLNDVQCYQLKDFICEPLN
ncbi:C-type lectin domain family 4 member E [Elysia marginata]|uniref:C-type lectin domain family 4 member E n=1 Tax=Elysia marginata TaxID=1093978 RepID=A0AAV4IB66_9GAST|nr:C-type lectin domain family 4 member E [Elysia marginata]